MCCKHETISARNEVRAEVSMSRTEDDLIVLSALDAVLHHVAVNTHIISVSSSFSSNFNVISTVQPPTVA